MSFIEQSGRKAVPTSRLMSAAERDVNPQTNKAMKKAAKEAKRVRAQRLLHTDAYLR